MKIIYSFLIAVLLTPIFSLAQQTNIFMDYSNLEVEYFKNGEGELKNRNIENIKMDVD